MAGVSDLQTTCASKRLIHVIAFSQSEFTSELVSHVFKFQLCGTFKSKQGLHIWEHHQFSFSAECVGRGSSFNQKGLTNMHAPAVDPFSPSGQQWNQKESMLHGGRNDYIYNKFESGSCCRALSVSFLSQAGGETLSFFRGESQIAKKIAVSNTYDHTLHKRAQISRDGSRLNYKANALR